MLYCATANPGRVRRWWHKSQSELGTSTYPLKLSGMEALRRRVERLSRTAGTLTVRLAPTLPGRSLTDASTAARSIHSDQLGIFVQTRILAEKGLTQETVDIYKKVPRGKGFGAHVLTGPIYIEGAAPGDALEVRVLGLEFRVPYGVNNTGPQSGVLPGLVPTPTPRIIK